MRIRSTARRGGGERKRNEPTAWLDDEPVGARLLLGDLLVLTDVYIGALRRAPGDGCPESAAAR